VPFTEQVVTSRAGDTRVLYKMHPGVNRVVTPVVGARNTIRFSHLSRAATFTNAALAGQACRVKE